MNFNNKLIGNYNEHKKNNVPFQNNPLLRNNQVFQNNMHYNNSNQMQQIQMMNNEHVNQLKNIQNIKKIEAFNKLDNKYNAEQIKNAIIKPQSIAFTKDEKIKQTKEIKELEKEYDNKSKVHLSQLKKHWNERTNEPYKICIQDEKYYGKFLKENLLRKQKLKKDEKKKYENDLIVHKVTDDDKKGVGDQFTKFKTNLETHNNELKVLYSLSNESQHKKKFEYNHVSKFRIKYNPSDHNVMKVDKMKYYKKKTIFLKH